MSFVSEWLKAPFISKTFRFSWTGFCEKLDKRKDVCLDTQGHGQGHVEKKDGIQNSDKGGK